MLPTRSGATTGARRAELGSIAQIPRRFRIGQQRWAASGSFESLNNPVNDNFPLIDSLSFAWRSSNPDVFTLRFAQRQSHFRRKCYTSQWVAMDGSAPLLYPGRRVPVCWYPHHATFCPDGGTLRQFRQTSSVSKSRFTRRTSSLSWVLINAVGRLERKRRRGLKRVIEVSDLNYPRSLKVNWW